MLEFLPGERFKFIPVTIVDNPVPELDKIFRVELYNAEAGGEKFDQNLDGGEDFFPISFHSLNHNLFSTFY